MAKTQEHRNLAISTPLGEDVLLLIKMSGTEQFGRPFEYRLELASEDHNINAEDIIGQNVTIRFELTSKETRYFNGFISRFIHIPSSGKFAQYQGTAVPWLWFLNRTADCRIFQEMKVPDIIKQIFRDKGFTDFDDALNGSYRTWEYCVQYRESDFNFVSRLMEQEGIYYFFKHEDGKHSLILADSASAHEPYPGHEELEYHPADKGTKPEECVSEWMLETNLQSGSYALNEFNFKKSKSDLFTRAIIDRQHAASKFEIYDYPGVYTEIGDGDEYARTRIEELQAKYEVVTAGSDSRGICTGCLFQLVNHTRDDQNREYMITSTNYKIDASKFYSEVQESDESFCYCEFTAIDGNQPFRSPRITPKPSIPGPQTAIVVGTKGEEIDTDEFGRVKVQFHWDRYGAADQNSSCWIRVAQVWAGKNWGAMYIPRIGQEVIVEFLEGDPDQPIITGRVYNDVTKPPYKLPAEKTKSTLKSNSSKGGGGFNEIRFEDKRGEEQIFIHAQNNMDIRVKNDRFETVGTEGEGSRQLVVEKDKKEHIKNERHEQVDNHHMEKIGGDRNLKVVGKEAKAIDGSKSLQVSGDVIEVFKDNHSEQVTNDYYIKGTNLVIEGTTHITIKVGQSYIAIEAGGIKIGTTGTLELESTSTLSAKGTAGVTIESPATAEFKSTSTTVKGDAMLTVQGGLVKIN